MKELSHTLNYKFGNSLVSNEKVVNIPEYIIPTGWKYTTKYICEGVPHKEIPVDLQVVRVNKVYYPYQKDLFVKCYNTGKLLFVKDNKTIPMMSPEGDVWAEPNTLINVLYDGLWYVNYSYFVQANKADSKAINKVYRPVGHFNYPYKLADYDAAFNLAFTKFKKVKTTPKNSILLLHKLLKGRSIGMELETNHSKVFLPRITEYGIYPLRDGSLPSGGVEFCTLPIESPKELQTVFNGIGILNGVCTVNTACAFHVHFGNLPKTKAFYTSLFILYQRMQDELLGMFPHYLKHPMGVVGKAKNYSDKLPFLPIMQKGIEGDAIEEAFKTIYHSFMGTGIEVNEFGKTIKTEWSRSWNCASRYVQLNFVNAFSKENGTIEFRLHPPTVNPQKIYLWIAITAAIILYAERNIVKILNSHRNREKILLTDVLEYLEIFDNELVDLKNILVEYFITQTNLRYSQEIQATTFGNSNGGISAKFSSYAKQATKELNEDKTYKFDIEYEI